MVVAVKIRWRGRAACRGADPELFFREGVVGEPGVTRAPGVTLEAKAICRGCPVRNDCLAHALSADEKYGIWGGTTPTVRKAIRRGEQRKTCPGCAHPVLHFVVIDDTISQLCRSCGLSWRLAMKDARRALALESVG
jgi:WhiB family transcriptional regulator, redox-sensing transcriptional regulator